MSRISVSSQPRALSLTEELEQIEQSITLTLQEIDHNFSRAHRTVTASILPVVEQYAEHSREVWEGAKFWKQFFESSANVSLSGYEEQPSVANESEETDAENSTATIHTAADYSESYATPQGQQYSNTSIEDIDFSNLTISPSHSTPRPHKQKHAQKPLPSYKALHRDVHGQRTESPCESDPGAPRTPPPQASIIDDIAITPADPRLVERSETAQKRSDPLLHTMLDKNYRIQATPMSTVRQTQIGTRLYRSGLQSGSVPRQAAEALDSSPLAPPQLHAEVFESPIRRGLAAARSRPAERVPGVSVLTPKRKEPVGAPTRTPGIWDSDDEEGDGIDELTGMPHGQSPPKTMQFHIPHSRLTRTPAREASKQIVGNILASAGVGRYDHEEDLSDDFEIDMDIDDRYTDENSPSVVRRATSLEEEEIF